MKSMQWVLMLALLLAGCVQYERKTEQIKIVRGTHEGSGLPMQYEVLVDHTGKEIKHGLFQLWYEGQKKYVEQNYVRGKMHGLCRIYGDDGRLYIEGIYRNDKPWSGTFQIGHRIEKYRDGRFVGVVREP